MSGQMDAPWFVVGRRFAGTRQAVEDARCANYIERTRILCFYSGKPAGDFTGKFLSALFASTLNVLTPFSSISFCIYSAAVSNMSSIFGAVSSAGLMEATPNTFEISLIISSEGILSSALTNISPSCLVTVVFSNLLNPCFFHLFQ